MNQGLRFTGLPNIPHKIVDNSDERERREGSRARQILRANKGLRKPEIFKPSDTVYLQDSEGKLTVPTSVVNQQQH